MNWKPVSEVPKFKVNPRGYSEHRDILVWIDDKNFKGFARGRCVKFEGLDYEFCADGYNGSWRITHWCYVEAPNGLMSRPATKD